MHKAQKMHFSQARKIGSDGCSYNSEDVSSFLGKPKKKTNVFHPNTVVFVKIPAYFYQIQLYLSNVSGYSDTVLQSGYSVTAFQSVYTRFQDTGLFPGHRIQGSISRTDQASLLVKSQVVKALAVAPVTGSSPRRSKLKCIVC